MLKIKKNEWEKIKNKFDIFQNNDKDKIDDNKLKNYVKLDFSKLRTFSSYARVVNVQRTQFEEALIHKAIISFPNYEAVIDILNGLVNFNGDWTSSLKNCKTFADKAGFNLLGLGWERNLDDLVASGQKLTELNANVITPLKNDADLNGLITTDPLDNLDKLDVNFFNSLKALKNNGGVPQTDYDKVVADLNALQTRFDELRLAATSVGIWDNADGVNAAMINSLQITRANQLEIEKTDLVDNDGKILPDKLTEYQNNANKIAAAEQKLQIGSTIIDRRTNQSYSLDKLPNIPISLPDLVFWNNEWDKIIGKLELWTKNSKDEITGVDENLVDNLQALYNQVINDRDLAGLVDRDNLIIKVDEIKKLQAGTGGGGIFVTPAINVGELKQVKDQLALITAKLDIKDAQDNSLIDENKLDKLAINADNGQKMTSFFGNYCDADGKIKEQELEDGLEAFNKARDFLEKIDDKLNLITHDEQLRENELEQYAEVKQAFTDNYIDFKKSEVDAVKQLKEIVNATGLPANSGDYDYDKYLENANRLREIYEDLKDSESIDIYERDPNNPFFDWKSDYNELTWRAKKYQQIIDNPKYDRVVTKLTPDSKIIDKSKLTKLINDSQELADLKSQNFVPLIEYNNLVDELNQEIKYNETLTETLGYDATSGDMADDNNLWVDLQTLLNGKTLPQMVKLIKDTNDKLGIDIATPEFDAKLKGAKLSDIPVPHLKYLSKCYLALRDVVKETEIFDVNPDTGKITEGTAKDIDEAILQAQELKATKIKYAGLVSDLDNEEIWTDNGRDIDQDKLSAELSKSQQLADLLEILNYVKSQKDETKDEDTGKYFSEFQEELPTFLGKKVNLMDSKDVYETLEKIINPLQAVDGIALDILNNDMLDFNMVSSDAEKIKAYHESRVIAENLKAANIPNLFDGDTLNDGTLATIAPIIAAHHSGNNNNAYAELATAAGIIAGAKRYLNISVNSELDEANLKPYKEAHEELPKVKEIITDAETYLQLDNNQTLEDIMKVGDPNHIELPASLSNLVYWYKENDKLFDPNKAVGLDIFDKNDPTNPDDITGLNLDKISQYASAPRRLGLSNFRVSSILCALGGKKLSDIPQGQSLATLIDHTCPAQPTCPLIHCPNPAHHTNYGTIHTESQEYQRINTRLNGQISNNELDALIAWSNHTCQTCSHSDYDTIKQERDTLQTENTQLKSHECDCNSKVAQKEQEILTKIITDCSLSTERERENLLEAVITEIKTKLTPPTDNSKDNKITELEAKIASLQAPKSLNDLPISNEIKTEVIKMSQELGLTAQSCVKLENAKSYQELSNFQKEAFQEKMNSEIDSKKSATNLNWVLGALSLGSLLILFWILIKRTNFTPELAKKAKEE